MKILRVFRVVSILLPILSSVPSLSASLPTKLSGKDLSAGEKAEIPLAATGKRGTVVVFISGKCPCSRAHEKHLRALAAEFGDDFRFVGVNSNQNEEEAVAREHFRTVALGFPVVRDEKARIADAFGALKTPHAFVVAPDGKTVVYRGGVTDSHKAESAGRAHLKETLTELRAGQSPSQADTRVLGCYINRGK